jgi:hypothetical protein
MSRRSSLASASVASLVSLAALLGACASAPPPQAKSEASEADAKPRAHAAEPALEYELGAVSPEILKKRLAALKPRWTACYQSARGHNETLAGTLTFTVRTNKDGSVKWAYVTATDLGDHDVEKCVIDSIKDTNWGTPVDAKEGEIKAHTFGWEIGEDEPQAVSGEAAQVMPAIAKAHEKLDACRKSAHATGTITATLTIAPKGKPLSVGIAVSDPSGDGAIDCLVGVLKGLTYTNRASQPIKVTVAVP